MRSHLTIEDIDFGLGGVIVRRGKGKKGRILSMMDPNDPDGGTTLRLLDQWIKARESLRHAGEHTHLWVSIPFGQPLNRATLRLG